MISAIEQYLTRGMERIGLPLDGGRCHALARYVELLTRWNRAYNLTSIRDPMEMVPGHILDCLVILPYVYGKRLLDIGTGAGLPGMVLAIARPDMECVLLDGNGKKTRFCRQAVMELGLSNVEVVRARVEEYGLPPQGNKGPGALFDTVTARAFGKLPVLRAHARRLLSPGGRLLAMKGTKERTMRDEGDGVDLEAAAIIELTVPDLNAERHLVIVEQDSSASDLMMHDSTLVRRP